MRYNKRMNTKTTSVKISEEALSSLLHLRGRIEDEIKSPVTLTRVLTDVLKIADEDEAMKNKLLDVARSRKNGEE